MAGLLPLLFYALFTRSTTFIGLNRLENSQYLQRLKQGLFLLEKSKHDLLTVTRDYATWDEMYRQVQSPNYSWLDQNLTGWVPGNFGIDSFQLLNIQGKTIIQYNELSLYRTRISERVEIKRALAGEGFADLLATPEGIFIIAVSPVLPQERPGPPNGVLLFAKKIDRVFLRTLEKQFGERITLESNGIWAGFIETVLILREIKPLEFNHSIDIPYNTFRPQNDVIVTYTTTRDLYGKYVNIIVSAKRTAIVAAISYLDGNIVPAIFIAFLCSLFLSYILAKFVILKPFHKLSKDLLEIKKSAKIKRLTTDGPTEITDLVGVFNEMSASLEDNIIRAKMLELQVNTDSLTGLYGYRYLVEYLNVLALNCQKFAVLFCDLDYFKHINENFGHVEGDNILKSVARVITSSVRDKGIAARYGGMNFSLYYLKLTIFPQ